MNSGPVLGIVQTEGLREGLFSLLQLQSVEINLLLQFFGILVFGKAFLQGEFLLLENRLLERDIILLLLIMPLVGDQVVIALSEVARDVSELVALDFVDLEIVFFLFEEVDVLELNLQVMTVFVVQPVEEGIPIDFLGGRFLREELRS